jgi:hypothetical protein
MLSERWLLAMLLQQHDVTKRNQALKSATC